MQILVKKELGMRPISNQKLFSSQIQILRIKVCTISNQISSLTLPCPAGDLNKCSKAGVLDLLLNHKYKRSFCNLTYHVTSKSPLSHVLILTPHQ